MENHSNHSSDKKEIYYKPDSPIDTISNGGFMKLLYCLCYPFKKRIITSDGKYWRHNVLCFDYTTDGKECLGLNEKIYVGLPIDHSEIEPDCFFCLWFCCGHISYPKEDNK